MCLYAERFILFEEGMYTRGRYYGVMRLLGLPDIQPYQDYFLIYFVYLVFQDKKGNGENGT